MSVIINNSDKPCEPQIKSQYDLPENWYVVADADNASDKALYPFEQDMLISPRSAMIIVDAQSYDKINGTDFSTFDTKEDYPDQEPNDDIIKMLK